MAASRTTLEPPSARMRSLRLRDLVYRDPMGDESWSRRRVPDSSRLRIDAASSPLVHPYAPLLSHVEKSIVRFRSPRAVGQWRDGLATGVWTFFDAAGNKDCAGRLDQGRRVGLWLYWYPSGTIDSMGEYADDLEEGPWISFHASGVIEEEGRYCAGEKVGVWTYVNRAGTRSVRDHGRR